MDAMVEDTRLPADIEAQPVVQAARRCGRCCAAIRRTGARAADASGFGGAVAGGGVLSIGDSALARGLQADPLTYLRVVELLAEGCGSVGWNSQ